MINPAHIHPLLVQIPIAVLPASVIIQITAQLKCEDLSSNSGFSGVGFKLLIFGTVIAYLSAGFGVIALDKALASGFAEEPLKQHQFVANSAVLLFAFASLTQILIRWRNCSLKGLFSWLILTLESAAVITLFVAVYYGHFLVLENGVNVETAKPVL